jgi:hypothetical protein
MVQGNDIGSMGVVKFRGGDSILISLLSSHPSFSLLIAIVLVAFALVTVRIYLTPLLIVLVCGIEKFT